MELRAPVVLKEIHGNQLFNDFIIIGFNIKINLCHRVSTVS